MAPAAKTVCWNPVIATRVTKNAANMAVEFTLFTKRIILRFTYQLKNYDSLSTQFKVERKQIMKQNSSRRLHHIQNKHK